MDHSCIVVANMEDYQEVCLRIIEKYLGRQKAGTGAVKLLSNYLMDETVIFITENHPMGSSLPSQKG